MLEATLIFGHDVMIELWPALGQLGGKKDQKTVGKMAVTTSRGDLQAQGWMLSQLIFRCPWK